MKVYKIKELCHLEKGKQIDTTLLNDSNPYKYINGGIKESGYYTFYNTEGEAVLISEGGASCGYVNYIDEKFWCGCHCYKLTDCKCLPKYLYYALKRNQNRLMELRTGAAMPNIKKATLQDMDLRLSEDTAAQKKVISNLDKLQSVISNRKQQLTRFDDLIKSRFIEMFGDPKINARKWNPINIGDLIQSCESGWSGNGSQRTKKPGEIAVLKVSSVTKGFFIPEECKVLDDQHNIKKYVFPEKGTLLFSRANTQEMVGATAVIFQDYPELILPDKLWKIRFANCANVLYMKYLLSHQSVRSKFSAVSTGTSGSMYNVSMEKFKSIVVPLPPIELQQQFADFVSQVDKSKLAIQKALDKAQLLFDSLLQEYFE